ncbi:Thioredoxin-like protein, partial [Globisporangium splendens]
MMLQSVRALTLGLAAALCATSVLQPKSALVAAKIDPNDKGDPLFPDGHPNITYLTDDNWDTWMEKTDKPWLVDFYHPFCPHCKQFVPSFLEIAAYYKAQGTVYVGAISCMDHVKCRRVGIKGFPTLITLNFDKTRPKQENKRVVGTHTIQEVKDYVNSVFMEAKINETGTQPPVDSGANLPTTVEVKPGEQLRTEIWEESTLPMNQTTRIQDAGSAFVFGLKQGVFMGREVLEDVELDALKGWLKMVSQTFPGSINRKIIKQLSDRVENIALLDFDAWDVIVKTWQKESVHDFEYEEAKLDFTGVTVPEWQRLSDLFLGEGVSYRSCALYTCGQWNMFHMLTMNPPEKNARSAELMVSVVASIRRFMKHFFGCVQCRDHFLAYNTIDKVKMIQDAENKPLTLKRWLWEMHNAVNTRIMHPQWPKPNICPTCGHEGNWELIEVDKWLGNTYAFREVKIPLKTEKPTEPPTEAPTEAPPTKQTEQVRTQQALRKVDNEKKANNGANGQMHGAATGLQGANGAYTPKDAEMGIANAANTKEFVVEAKTKSDDEGGLQSARAPPVSLFAWYILPVAAVGAYLLFVRSRNSKLKSFRQRVGKE